MILFLLGMFCTATILLIIFIIKFFDLSALAKEKVSKENKKEEKKDFDEVSNIDKSAFFK